MLVVGLGRFGGSLATTLVELGHEVLGVDNDPVTVQRYANLLTHVVVADTTDVDALRQIGAADFPVAVVGIGSGIEASVLSTAALIEVGVRNIWAKAITAAHGRILELVGAEHVIYPEREMGERVAHLVTGRMLDFIELDPGFALVETVAPQEIVGKSLVELSFRTRYGVTVVCIKPRGGNYTYAQIDTVVQAGDTLLVAGETKLAEAFANLD